MQELQPLDTRISNQQKFKPSLGTWDDPQTRDQLHACSSGSTEQFQLCLQLESAHKKLIILVNNLKNYHLHRQGDKAQTESKDEPS